jgi:hypothetical protein
MNVRALMAVRSTGRTGGDGPQTGVFITKESLTFPFAVLFISGLLQVLNMPFPGARTSFWWSLGLSALIGLLIYINSTPGGQSPTDRVTSIVITALNVLVLAGAALGVGATVGGDPTDENSAGEESAMVVRQGRG